MKDSASSNENLKENQQMMTTKQVRENEPSRHKAPCTVYYRVKGENLRLVFVVKIHGSPFTWEILLDS